MGQTCISVSPSHLMKLHEMIRGRVCKHEQVLKECLICSPQGKENALIKNEKSGTNFIRNLHSLPFYT